MGRNGKKQKRNERDGNKYEEKGRTGKISQKYPKKYLKRIAKV